MTQTILVVDDSRTVRSVVERTLSRAGYRVLLAASGREAIEHAKGEKLDLVLVDLVMPEMAGSDLCVHLRDEMGITEVPFVLMSSRGSEAIEEVLEMTGAVDAIHKPFGPEALRVVTAKALTTSMDSIRPFSHSKPPGPREEPTETDPNALAASRRLAESLGSVVRQFTGTSTPTDEQVALALSHGFSAESLADTAQAVRGIALGATVPIALEGDASIIPLPDVLQVLQHQRLSGVFTIHKAGRSIVICFRDGVIDIALGHGGEREFLLGRYLIERKAITEGVLEATIDSQEGGPWLGGRLLAQGHINKDTLQGALRQQSSELLYEALRWNRGSYRFEPGVFRPEANDAQLGVPMASVLMEGLRRIDEWRLIEEKIQSFDLVLEHRRDALAAFNLSDLDEEEDRILQAIDGKRTVSEIVEHSSMSSFAA
ncbi:MAG: response regulator [Myxococcales bacterium]|nr:response regulator [Myxococcales bacterium]